MAKKKSIKDFTALSSMSASLVLKNLPFVFFRSFLAVIYIANAHYSEKKVRQIQQLDTELKQLRWKYMSVQSELNFKSKRAEVLESVKDLNLKTNTKRPNKIKVPKDL